MLNRMTLLNFTMRVRIPHYSWISLVLRFIWLKNRHSAEDLLMFAFFLYGRANKRNLKSWVNSWKHIHTHKRINRHSETLAWIKLACEEWWTTSNGISFVRCWHSTYALYYNWCVRVCLWIWFSVCRFQSLLYVQWALFRIR